jgi:hypothetical protein
MTECSVIHDTFTIERSYPAAPSRMFAAFASAEAKNIWGDTGDLELADGQAGVAEFDFRAGRVPGAVAPQGRHHRDARRPDPVPGLAHHALTASGPRSRSPRGRGGCPAGLVIAAAVPACGTICELGLRGECACAGKHRSGLLVLRSRP